MNFWALMIVVCVSLMTAGADVVLVGTVDGMIEGEVVEVSVDGVSVRIDREGVPSRTRVVPWFAVREAAGGWVVPGEFEEMARVSAIGHARRERGDLSGCADLYAGLAAGLVGSESDMAIEVFGGLLDEAVVRGDFFDAAVAMVALKSVPAMVLKSGVDGFDGRYRVHVGVPLLGVKVGGHRLEAVGEVIGEGGGSGGVLVRAFGFLNGAGDGSEDVRVLIEDMATQQGMEVQDRQGLELYLNMLIVQVHPDGEARDDARRWLGFRSASKSGTWIDAWCRLAIGVSYIEESDRTDNDEMLSRGVVELVHVMVRFRESHPELARVAREIAVEGLSRDGRIDEAAELVRSFDTMTGMTE
ncbi:MAG: hypothetical protein JKY43_00020 [Phycisphaerales bacterium]|nr:hypothetical protein [Phycisphaerales bacterium]